ncbi:Rz1 gp24' [Burkholderia phage KS9]|uniref:Rz-like spanin n=1 Tax=Burkholderia phage KS9 TaxID=335797 RepID=UPI0001B07E6E|nr:Rz-like spanin [Burkholderia phage KS9]ACT83036.1 Rz1 gp24' [Burkholderia phage KS9]
MLRTNVIRRALMLPALLLLLTACASKSTSSSPVHAIPAMRPEARQPSAPSICLPTCSAGLTRLRENSRESLTSGALPGGSAKATTTR